MSSISIIGTGKMAHALGTGWHAAGHTITLGSRQPEKAEAHVAVRGATVTIQASALDAAEIVVLAIPYPSVAAFVTKHRAALHGKTIIDISNPFDALPHNGKAGAEYTAEALGTPDGLVAAFKDNFAATINQQQTANATTPEVKIAGDDKTAKSIVSNLAADLNHPVLDCGPLTNARYIDAMVSLMLILDDHYANSTQTSGWKSFGLRTS